MCQFVSHAPGVSCLNVDEVCAVWITQTLGGYSDSRPFYKDSSEGALVTTRSRGSHMEA